MSPVEFKKRPCRPVEFKGQGPSKGTDISNTPSLMLRIVFLKPPLGRAMVH